MDSRTAGVASRKSAERSGTKSGGGLRQTVEELSRSHREPEWLLDLRLEALETYQSGPLPDRVGHLWRYTDPQQFTPLEGNAVPAPAASQDGRQDGKDWPAEIRAPLEAGELAGAAWVVGGSLRRVYLDPALEKAGVLIEDLHGASRGGGASMGRADLVRRHLGALVPSGSGKFEALNAALWNGGLLIHAPRGVEVKKPIHLLTSVDGAALLAPRVLLVADEGSSLTVLDEYVGGGKDPVQAHVTIEAFAGPSASLRHMVIQRLGPQVALHLSQRAGLQNDAKLVSVIASLGASVAKADIGTILQGRGAEVELSGFLFGEGRQHFDHHTVHDHRAPHTLSDLDFKVVLKDRSRSAYTGLIRIAPEAPNSEAYQENRNLFLNEGAKADSIPELEILTDEVMCTHGATMGPLDPEQIFYLASRGIPRREAARMIVGGFIEPTLNRLPEDLRERLRAHVDAGLLSI